MTEPPSRVWLLVGVLIAVWFTFVFVHDLAR